MCLRPSQLAHSRLTFEILFDDDVHPKRWDLRGLFIKCNESERLLLYRPVNWPRFEILFDDIAHPTRWDL
jgi:hypothetical protein